MEKKIKVLLWTAVGIVAAILVSSIILAFVAPSYLITLWAGIVGGGALCLVWKYRNDLLKWEENKLALDIDTPILKDEAEEVAKKVEEEEKPVEKKSHKSSKRK